MMKRLIAILISCLAFLNGSGDVLYWTIDTTSFVDDDEMYSFISPLPDDDNWAVGRVKITSVSGEVKYLDTYVPSGNQNIPGITLPGNEGYYVGGGGSFEGIPENTQAILPSGIDATTALFAIEIGMNHWVDDGTELGRIDFELLAITDPHTYEQLRQFMYIEHDMNPPSLLSWNPKYYHTVPEP